MGSLAVSSTLSAFSFVSSPSFFRPASSVVCLSLGNPKNPRPRLRNYSAILNPSTAFNTIKSLASRGLGLVEEFNGEYYQNGALGVALLSVTTTAKVRFSPFLATLAANPTFVSGLFAWFVAQSVKVILNFFIEKKLDLRIMFASGGMPSSHTALCTALTTSVALCHGVADALFPVSLGFSLIVMYDATGVRRHAGMQAEVMGSFFLSFSSFLIMSVLFSACLYGF